MSSPRAVFVALILAGLAAIGAMWVATDRIIGPDDGIYLAGARSLAESGRYMQSFLPAPVPQTKYPPLYSLCLAVVGAATSFAPGAFWYLKIVNALALAGLVFLTMRLVNEESGSTRWTLVGGALVATAPALFAGVDLLGSDPLFTLLVVLAVVLVPRTDTTAGCVTVALVAALSALTRAVGLALCVGLAWHALMALPKPRARVVLATIAVVVTPWFIWRMVVFPSEVAPIDTYYLGYEPSAWQIALTRPADALRSIWTNLRVYPTLAPMVFGWPLPWLVAIAAPVSLIGLRYLAAPRRSLLARSGAIYLVGLMGHPYPIDRYLVPMVPLVLIGLVLGLSRLGRRDVALRAAALALAGMMVVIHAAWMGRYVSVARHSLHGAFGRPLNFQWEGFSDALGWISAHTRSDDSVASFRDAVVYAYTGRRGVRAWLHLPEAWSSEKSRMLTAAEVARVVERDLDRLGVDYILVGPPLEDVEGRFGEAVLTEMGLGGPIVPLAYTSRDGSHRVYRRTGSDPSSGLK